ncbi:MAG: hypothetical protein ACYDA6_02050 [Solirubrobacteraceae bacterium]
MGLLDDAIREHLELKRLRGADPGDVLRQEREVLGTSELDRDPADGVDPHGHGIDPDSWALDAERMFGEPGTDQHADADADAAAAATGSSLDQETAEVDMREVLELEGRTTEEDPAPEHTKPKPPADEADWPTSASL